MDAWNDKTTTPSPSPRTDRLIAFACLRAPCLREFSFLFQSREYLSLFSISYDFVWSSTSCKDLIEKKKKRKKEQKRERERWKDNLRCRTKYDHSDKVQNQEMVFSQNLRETCRRRNATPCSTLLLSLASAGFPLVFTRRRNFTTATGRQLAAAQGGNGAETRPSPLRTAARERGEGRKEHDIAAFIKLNVSFPDRAFPGEGTLLSDQLPPPFLSSFLPSFFRGNADRVGSPLPSHTILFPSLLKPSSS